MNKKERKAIATIADEVEADSYTFDEGTLDDLKTQIECMAEDESAKFDNLSEGLRESEKGQAIEEAVRRYEAVSEKIDDAIGAIQALDTARQELIEALRELASEE